MRKIFLFTLFLFPIAVSADCYSISNSDSREYCLGTQKNDSSHCYRISNSDRREYCLAIVNQDKSFCYRIGDSDRKEACLSEM